MRLMSVIELPLVSDELLCSAVVVDVLSIIGSLSLRQVKRLCRGLLLLALFLIVLIVKRCEFIIGWYSPKGAS